MFTVEERRLFKYTVACVAVTAAALYCNHVFFLPENVISRYLKNRGVNETSQACGLTQVSTQKYIMTDAPIDPATGVVLKFWTIHTIKGQYTRMNSVVSDDLQKFEAAQARCESCGYLI